MLSVMEQMTEEIVKRLVAGPVAQDDETDEDDATNRLQ